MKKFAYLKSKKGFSLVELLCAVVIMAIVVSCTATGLAVSYRSIILSSLKDQASAKAQEYCDVIMTTVQHTPSNEPGTIGADDSKNNLFASSVVDIKHTLKTNVQTYIDTTCGVSLDQVTDSQAESRVWAEDDVYYYIKNIGQHGSYINYEIKVYVTYGSASGGHVTYCKGTVSKPVLAS